MIASVVTFTVICLFDVNALPVSQPAYSNNQYYAAPQQYLQQIQNQPQYISVPPIPQAPTSVYEGAPHQQVSQQFIPSPPTQRVSQLLLPSAADRQVQKAAEQIAGPQYAQQVQLAQQQGLANEAVATAQRRAQAQLRRAQLQAQQAQQSQQQQSHQQQQYVEVAPRQQYVQVQVPQQVQPQQYQLQYEQVYQQQPTAKPLRAIAQPQRHNQVAKEQEPEEEHDVNSSYQFGFDVNDDIYTNYQNRKESRENGKISGSYSVVDSDGFIRTVTYTADPKEGFKAEVVRKPTDIVVKIPQPKEQPQEQPQEQQHQQQQYQQYIREESPVQRYQPVQQQQHQQYQQQQKPNIVYQYQ